MSSFQKFGLLKEIGCFLEEASLKEPTEVQRKGIPALLRGESLSVLAQTGTGKTLAYALPLFHLIKSNDESIPMESQIGAPRAVILTPTRELNFQVTKVFKSISHHAKLRIRTLTGGDKGKISRKIADTPYDILVSSPSRLKSALERSEVKSSLLEFLILDEADQLLDMGFTKDILRINELLKREKGRREIQLGLFSATWPGQYKNFISEVFPEYELNEIICQGGVQLKRNIETYNISVSSKEKNKILEDFFKNYAKGTGVVFANRKEDVNSLFSFLKEKFPRRRLNILHGGLSQRERREAFTHFRERGGVLISSDIAARGFDIKNLSWVLNYDLPFEAVYYIHRCGRTGREGKLGKVYNFVTALDQKLVGRINEAILSQSSLALSPLGMGAMGKTTRKTTRKTTKKKTSRSSLRPSPRSSSRSPRGAAAPPKGRRPKRRRKGS